MLSQVVSQRERLRTAAGIPLERVFSFTFFLLSRPPSGRLIMIHVLPENYLRPPCIAHRDSVFRIHADGIAKVSYTFTFATSTARLGLLNCLKMSLREGSLVK